MQHIEETEAHTMFIQNITEKSHSVKGPSQLLVTKLPQCPCEPSGAPRTGGNPGWASRGCRLGMMGSSRVCRVSPHFVSTNVPLPFVPGGRSHPCWGSSGQCPRVDSGELGAAQCQAGDQAVPWGCWDAQGWVWLSAPGSKHGALEALMGVLLAFPRLL